MKSPPLPSGLQFFRYQKPYLKYSSDSTSYEVILVADKDKKTKNDAKGNWETILRKGTLVRKPDESYSFRWHAEEITLSTNLAESGRALELSELVFFVDRLYAPDDRTGVVFSIEDGKAIPTYILMDGDGHSTKGFKTEWGTVKDGEMWLGGLGKEWTDNSGRVLNSNPLWVKVIDAEGRIRHVDWKVPYGRLREATNTVESGYLIHEAVVWHPFLRRWYFLPRRHSTEMYNDELDEEKGCNMIISADETFTTINVTRIGTLTPTRGFSSVSLLPGRENHLVALKSLEYKDEVASYILVIDIETGKVLMEEEFIGNAKFEGIEVI